MNPLCQYDDHVTACTPAPPETHRRVGLVETDLNRVGGNGHVGDRRAAMIRRRNEDVALDPRHEVEVVHRAVIFLTEEARELVVA